MVFRAVDIAIIKIRYLTEPRDQICVKCYRILSFAKNIGKHLSNNDSQNLFDSAKKSTTDAIKTTLKRAIKKQPKQLVI